MVLHTQALLGTVSRKCECVLAPWLEVLGAYELLSLRNVIKYRFIDGLNVG
jgi:hypothetical protein